MGEHKNLNNRPKGNSWKTVVALTEQAQQYINGQQVKTEQRNSKRQERLENSRALKNEKSNS